MRPYHLTALLVLLYWQLGPLPQAHVAEDGQTRWSLSAMAGAGRWEEASFDCDGNHTGSVAENYRDIGGRVDVESGMMRFSVAAGSARRNTPSDSTLPGFDLSWMTYGAQFAVEGRPVGGGVGLVRHEDGRMLPSVYFRAGSRDGSHFRMEVMPLSETRMMAGLMRIGVGFPRGYAGVTFSPTFERFDMMAVFADIGIPVSRNLDLRLAGTAGPGIDVFQYGAAAGLRIRN